MFMLNPTKGLQHGCLEILFVPSSPRLCKCFQAPTEVDSCEWWTTAVWQNLVSGVDVWQLWFPSTGQGP